MAMTYSTLVGTKATVGSIRSYQNYDKVDADGVLADAQALIFQSMRVREMRASATLSLALGDSTKALPTGFLDPRVLLDLTNGGEITLVDEERLVRSRYYSAGVLQTGDPTSYAIFDELVNIDCKARAALTAQMLYWKSPTALGLSNEANFLTTRYPHILRTACLMMAAKFASDAERYAREEALLFPMLEQANVMDEMSRRGQETPVNDGFDAISSGSW